MPPTGPRDMEHRPDHHAGSYPSNQCRDGRSRPEPTSAIIQRAEGARRQVELPLGAASDVLSAQIANAPCERQPTTYERRVPSVIGTHTPSGLHSSGLPNAVLDSSLSTNSFSSHPHERQSVLQLPPLLVHGTPEGDRALVQQFHRIPPLRHLGAFPPREQPCPPPSHQQAAPARPPGSLPMPYVRSEIAILNAEQYDAGIDFSDDRTTAKVSARPPVGGGPVTRKRTRAEATDGADKDGDRKRARGRPRLDTNGESAADVSGSKL